MNQVELPEDIQHFQINDVNLHSEQIWLKLGMINPTAGKPTQYELLLRGLVYLRLSKDGEGTGVYPIFEFEANRLTDPETFLAEMGYGFTGFSSANDYYHVRIEGEICLDVVSTTFEITRAD